jgi:predicted O-methyltransferase YrrM
MTYYPKIKNPLYLKHYLKKIDLIKKSNSLEKLIDFTFLDKNLLDFLFLGKGVIYTKQFKSEILELLKLLEKKKPKVILEIGTAGGGTLFLLSQIAHPEAVLVSVDLPGPFFGESYPEWKGQIYRYCLKQGQKLYLIKANSHKQKTLDRIRQILELENRKLDFLFIDGDHTYEGVKMDFQMYNPLVKKGGLIAFHDIVEVPDADDVEVDLFWKEIKKEFKYEEWVEDWNQGMCGIGLIYKNY